jgi:hypothetical protein
VTIHGGPGDGGDRRDALALQRRRVDGIAPLRIARLRGVEDEARVADEGVVPDGLERVAEEGIDVRALRDAGVDGGEGVDLGLEVARGGGRVDGGFHLRRVDA